MAPSSPDSIADAGPTARTGPTTDAPDPALDRRRRDRRRSRSGDRLTGLADRDVFVRAVDQADRDRDRMVVAVVTVDGLAEINQLCGYDVGDSLLAALGRALATRTSVDVTTARIGGGHLGMLQAPAHPTHPLDLLGPILDDLDAATDAWLDERAALGSPCPIEPRPRAGVAAGYGGGTWSDAEVALSVAIDDPDGQPAVHFDLRDGRLAAQRRRQRLADDVADALHHHRLPVDQLAVVALDRLGPSTGTDPSAAAVDPTGDDRNPAWTRLRPRPAVGPSTSAGDRRADGGVSGTDLALAPGLAGRLDQHLVARAEELRSGPIASAPAVSVPLLGPLVGPRSVLADGSHGDLVVEVDQAALASTDTTVVSDRLTRLGWQVAIVDFDGGWEAWTLVERLPVHHVRPRADLIRRAMAEEPTAVDILRSIGTTAAERGILVAAGPEAASALGAVDRLRGMGLTHLDRPGHRMAEPE